MGMIGRWIDEKCKHEPEVMRRVLNRKFGPLNRFITEDKKCGCLVGSWALESGQLAGYAPSSGMAQRNYDIGLHVNALTMSPPSRRRYVRNRSYCSPISRSPETERRVVRLLKQRIRKSLGIAPVNRPVPLETVTQ